MGAAEYFEHTQPRLESASPGERARYGLYRGATLLTLGDIEAADHWIAYAVRESKGHPHALDADEARMLNRALRVRASFATAAPRGGVEAHAAND